MDDSKMPRIRRKEDLPDVMTMPLVAKTLGCSLTVAYRLLKRDDFPHTVSGQRAYIDKGKFLSWLDAQTQMEKRDHYGWYCIPIFIKEFNSKCFAIAQNIDDGTFSPCFDPSFGIIIFQGNDIEKLQHGYSLTVKTSMRGSHICSMQ